MSDEWSVFAPPRPLLPTLRASSWEDDPGSPLRERRRKADGSFEYRPKAGAMGPGPVAVGNAEDPYAERHGAAVLADQAILRAKQAGGFLMDLPSMVAGADRAIARKIPRPLAWAAGVGPAAEAARQTTLPEDLKPSGVLGEVRRQIDEEAEAGRGAFQQSQAAKGRSPLATALAETGADVVLDPFNLVGVGQPAAKLAKEVSALRTVAERETAERFLGGVVPRGTSEAGAVKVPEWLRRFMGRHPEIDPDLIDLRSDALERMARAEEATAGLPEPSFPPAEPPPPALPRLEGEMKPLQSNNIDEVLEEERRLRAAKKDWNAYEVEQGWRARPEEAEGLLVEELTGPPAPPRSFDEMADEAMAGLRGGRGPRSLPGAGGGTPPGGIVPPGGAGGPGGPFREPIPEMSTKALRNVAGMQEEFGELVTKHADAIYAARGPVRSASVWHDAKALADDLNMRPEDFLRSPAGRTFDDREVSLARHYMGGMKQQVNDLAGKLASGELPSTPENLARLAEMDLDTVRMAKLVQGQGMSTAGRVLRSGQEALSPFLATPKDRLRAGLLKRYADSLDDDTIKMLADLPGDESDPGALISFLRKMERPEFRDYRMSYFINSILSGTPTLARNLAGNVVRLAEQTAMRPAGAVVEQGLAKLQGRAPERLVRETLPATMGLFRGLPEAIKRFAFVMKNGYDPTRLIAELTGEGAGKFGERLPLSPFMLSESKTVRGVGVAVTMPGRILEATDAFFKILAGTSENYAWATRMAIQEKAPDVGARVAQLVAEQPDEMVTASRAFARKATYTDPMSAIGGWATQGRKTLGTVGEHLLPFVHVSDRVAAAVTDYIPGAKPGKLYRLLKAKDPEASDLIARQVVGGVVGMYALSLASQGRLTGALPRDPKLRNDAYAEGRQPWSILIGGHWVPIRDTLGPLAGPFVAAAMYHDHLRAGEDPSDAIPGMVLGSARYMLDASYLQTLSDVVQAVDEDSSGDVGRKASSATARVVGGYAPFSGLERNIAKATDLGEGGAPRVVERQGFTDEIKSNLPGLRRTLPPKLDVLGAPLEISTGVAGAFSPIVPTESKIADPRLEEEVGRLRFTLANRATELGRLQKALANAQKTPGQESRAEEILAELPPLSDPEGVLRGALDSVRKLEDQVRRLRADPEAPPEAKRQIEVELQQRMRELMQQALDSLSTTPAAEDEWSVFAPEVR